MLRRSASLGLFTLAAAATTTLSLKEWSAMLQPQNGSTVSGTATVQALVGDSVAVTIRVKGAKTGDVNPWHVHSGGCDSSGAIIGDASRYAPMTIDGDMGEATARIKTVFTVGVPYSINVHRSAADMGVIACGNLRPVAGR